MAIMSKYKIIQVIENYGSCELLEYRLKNFEQVDYFLIVGSIDESLLETYKHKIHFISVNSNDDTYSIITEKLFSICEGSDEIIILSRSEEFCDFSNFEEITEELNYNPMFLKHTEFWWGKNYISKNRKLGSFVFLFLHLILDRKLLSRKVLDKNTNSNFYRYSPINGWAFNGMYDWTPEDVIFKESLSPRGTVVEKLISFDNKENVPPNFHELPDLIISDNHNFKKVVNISFVTDTFDSVSVSDNFLNYNFIINLPKKVLYGDKNYDEFIQEYKQREIRRIINSLGISDQDTLQIKNPS